MTRDNSLRRTSSARRFDALYAEGWSGCPACGVRHPIAPVGSRHLAPDRIEHDWHCDSCGHDWTTSLAGTGGSLRPGATPRHDNDADVAVFRIVPADRALLRNAVIAARMAGSSAVVLPFRL